MADDSLRITRRTELFRDVESRLLGKEMQNSEMKGRREAARAAFKSKQARPQGRNTAAITDGGLFIG